MSPEAFEKNNLWTEETMKVQVLLQLKAKLAASGPKYLRNISSVFLKENFAGNYLTLSL